MASGILKNLKLMFRFNPEAFAFTLSQLPQVLFQSEAKMSLRNGMGSQRGYGMWGWGWQKEKKSV